MSDNVKVFGSFHFSESCTFDPDNNLVLAMNTGNRGDGTENDGFVSLINPDGSVHTAKWIGVNRDGLELHHPLGSAISHGFLYTVDLGYVRSFDLATGQPLKAVPIRHHNAERWTGSVLARIQLEPEPYWAADGRLCPEPRCSQH